MNLAKNESCSECGRFDNRPITTDAVVVKNNKILLVKRGHDPYKGYWALPGGFVEWNQTVEETVERELKEETNLDATVSKLIGVYSDPQRDPRQPISVAYSVNAEGKERSGDDAVDLKWFDLDNLPELAFDHNKIIGDASVLVKKVL